MFSHCCWTKITQAKFTCYIKRLQWWGPSLSSTDSLMWDLDSWTFLLCYPDPYIMHCHVPVQVQPGGCNLLGVQHWSGRLWRADHWLVQRVDEQPNQQQVCSPPLLHFFHSLSTLTFYIKNALIPSLLSLSLTLCHLYQSLQDKSKFEVHSVLQCNCSRRKGRVGLCLVHVWECYHCFRGW